MARRPQLALAVLLLAPLTPSLAQGQRPTGKVGEYVPPRTWPQRARVFDLLHQRMKVSYDLDQRSVRGEVLTRLVVTAAPTDTIRLDASNLTIDAASDARGRRLRFTADTSGVTVRLPRRASVGDTVAFSLTYHGRPERGMYFVPRRQIMWTQGEAIETPSWVPTYNAPNDKTTWEILVTTDSGMRAVSNGRLVEVTPAPGGKRVWHWSQDLPASTYLYSIVAGPLAVAVATRYLGDGDPLFAVSAVEMLGRVGGAQGRATLQAARAHETRVTVRAAMDRVLGQR